ncbi:MAG TPA: ATP-binding cassette domain-containing protein [Candidatus Methylacidiphilales bacterium]|nr:ATP-binding cassette domain-containing protein [Candidatus Methylacidiphilales bacterium]
MAPFFVRQETFFQEVVVSQIVAERLVKSYDVPERGGGLSGLFSMRTRKVYALKDVSFRIERGELLGYIGPNGAGKSTTVKILSGILVPDSGECRVDGRVPWSDRIAHVARIGVVFGQRTQLWWDLPVIESLDLLRDMYGLSQAEYRPWRDVLIERLDIGSFLQQPVRQLSLGQRMRADLAASLVHRPGLLFLDEPTIGLDAVSKLAVRKFLMELNRDEGLTVILTTHDLDDIETLCRRVMVIGEGRVLSDGSVENLRRQVSDERVLRMDLRDAAAAEAAATNLAGLPVRIVSREGGRVVLRFDPDTIPPTELLRRITERCEVTDLFIEFTPIEEIVAQLYTKHQAASSASVVPAEGAV